MVPEGDNSSALLLCAGICKTRFSRTQPFSVSPKPALSSEGGTMSTTASAEPKISPEFAAGVRDFMLMGIENEIPKTMAVIGAVPDGKRDWKPDPSARSGWDLAWHLACEDVLFLDQIVEGKFAFPDTRYDKEKPATSADLATWY